MPPDLPGPHAAPENVVFFPTAAAAQEAGFRPCLRCRPETSPDLGAWRGASNTVSRALALVEMGALDEASVDALASRVGVGERQLRRLFQQHLGASPIAVAQSRRVLLAKQLIHETRLPMTEIAMAAGFGSLRRFNDTFQALFQRPPIGAAPRRTGRDVSAGPSGEISLKLRYRPPYDWPAMLGFLRARAITGVESVDDGVYRRTIGLEGEQGTVTVRPAERQRAECHRAVPEAVRPAADHRAVAAGFRPRRRPGRHRAPSGEGSRRWRRWSPPGRACAFPAPGTGSNWRCARCWDSRSPSPQPPRWPAA